MKFLTLTDRYIARLIAVPLVTTLLLTAMLLLLDKMRRLFDFVAQEGGPISVVWQMLANSLPEYLSLGIPVGLLLGILLAFRKLSISSELDVLRALGWSYGRLLRVPYIFAIALAFLNLAVVGFVAPYSQYAYEGLRYELRSGALGASMKVGEFNKLGQHDTLRIEKSQNDGKLLTGIFVATKSDDGRSSAVTAETGSFFGTDDPDTIIFRLHNGVLVSNAPSFKVPRILTFASQDLPIALPKIENFRGRGASQHEELTVPELVRIGNDSRSPGIDRLQSRVEFHFRIVQVAIMLVVPLLAMALAVPPKRSTSSLGVFLSILMIVFYYKVNQYAAGVADLGHINPILALWTPFTLFSALCLWMYHTLAHKPGGQPIGALERFSSKLVTRITSFWLRKGGSLTASF